MARLRCAVLVAAALFPAPAAAEVCAHESTDAAAAAGKRTVNTTGSLGALVIFAKFRGEATGSDAAPGWANDLFNPGVWGSFSHFYNEMSGGQLTIEGQVLPKRYTSLQGAEAYLADTPGGLGRFRVFNLEILDQADRDVDMGLFDNDGPDGVSNSGDDDGYVDILFINLLTVPTGFLVDRASGIASLGLEADYLSDDPGANGRNIRIRSRYTGFGGTTQRGHTFTVTAGTMCHEFAHVLGLPDLFDQSSIGADGDFEPEEDSAGIGRWGLMGLGTLGWGIEDGPNAFCAFSRAQLGWIGENNDRLITVTESMRDVVIGDVDQGGRVYKIPIGRDEYYLLENRQRSGGYYDRNIPGQGLLLWHVDERADNDEERHKQVDLVCADGLYSDVGFPGGTADVIRGRDNLDFRARDTAYNTSHNGNEGDATDVFDGVRFTRFAHDTNPRPSAHSGFSRNLPVGIALESIRAEGGDMVVDILVRQPLQGHVSADTTWTGKVEIDGDIVVEPGATLTIAGGTEVRFASRTDVRASGFDSLRSEILVFGDLVLQGERDPIEFRSAASRPRARDWGGVHLLDAQDPDLTGVTFDHSEGGLVRSHLPPGVTRWGGERVVPRDLVVPAGSELRIAAGTTVAFSRSDQSGGGASPALTELTLEGALTVEGESGARVLFTRGGGGDDDIWFGIKLEAGSRVQAHRLEVERSLVGFGGHVDAAGSLRIEDGLFHDNVGGGLRLTVNGEVEVLRTTFSGNSTFGLLASGSGLLRLTEVVVADNVLDGVALRNCNLEAIDVELRDNGRADPEYERSGLLAVGGRGQTIKIWDSRLEGNGHHGLDLELWEGVVEVHRSEVRANRAEGVSVVGAERLVFEDVQVVRNLQAGVFVEEAVIELWTTTYSNNIGTGLVLGKGATGVIERNQFVNNSGISLDQVRSLIVRSSSFDNTPIGIESISSAPTLLDNLFDGNLTALKVSGNRVPAELSRNSFIDNDRAIENLSLLEIPATGNFWGTADSTAIGELIVGDVDWSAFLRTEPGMTEEAAVPASGELPEKSALGANYPNPFNTWTRIPFALAVTAPTRFVIYDPLGRVVHAWSEGQLPAGFHEFSWDGRDQDGREAATGVYVYRVVAGEFAAARPLLLLR